MLIFAISTSRVTSQLNENAEDILDKQVENRANYLRQNLIQAQDLNAISGTIDGVTRELVDQGIVDLNTLDTSSEEALPLLQAIVPELVSTLRTKPVNGIFVILSTHDLNHRADDSYLPGLYIRDLDSSALSTDRNADLLAERGPATAFAPLGISTDKGWSPAMPYQPDGKTSFYKESFQIAYASKSKLSANRIPHGGGCRQEDAPDPYAVPGWNGLEVLAGWRGAVRDAPAAGALQPERTVLRRGVAADRDRGPK